VVVGGAAAVDAGAVDEFSRIVEWSGTVVAPLVDVWVSESTGAVVKAEVVDCNGVVVKLLCAGFVGSSDGRWEIVTGFAVVTFGVVVVVSGDPVVSGTADVGVSVGLFVIGAVDAVVGAVVDWLRAIVVGASVDVTAVVEGPTVADSLPVGESEGRLVVGTAVAAAVVDVA